MLNRKSTASWSLGAAVAAVAAALMASHSSARADENQAAPNDPATSFTLSRPIYAEDAAPRKPFMALMDMAGLGPTLDEWGINIGGWIEAGYTYNFRSPENPYPYNFGRVFDFEDDRYVLDQIDLSVDRTINANPDKFDIGGKMEWMYGADARFIHSNGLFDSQSSDYLIHANGLHGSREQFDLVQAYLTFNVPVGNGLLVTAGKFVTPMGYETINPITNPLYSHSFLFGFAIPFTHTGITAKYQLDKEWSVMGGVVRGWDQALEDNNDYPSYMGQIAYSKDQLDFYLSAITGCEQANDNSDYRTVIDTVVVYRMTDTLSFGLNGDFGWEPDSGTPESGGTKRRDAIWWGGAAYMTWKIDNHFTWQGRAEYFNDDKGARGLGSEFAELTGGINIKPMPDDKWFSGLIIRPELRYDWASEKRFDFDRSSGALGAGSQFTFGIDAIYAF